MAMKWNRRSVMGAVFAAAVPVSAGMVVGAEEKSATAVKGTLTDQSRIRSGSFRCRAFSVRMGVLSG